MKKNDTARYKVEGFLKITDQDTGALLVEKKNAIHFGNLTPTIAAVLSGQTNNKIRFMAIGNGGTERSLTGEITYNPPNVSNTNSTSDSLYSEIDNIEFGRVASGSTHFITTILSSSDYTDISMRGIFSFKDTLSNTQSSIDRLSVAQHESIIDEVAIYNGPALATGALLTSSPAHKMLTHVVFHPIQKSLNRAIIIDYVIRIYLVANVEKGPTIGAIYNKYTTAKNRVDWNNPIKYLSATEVLAKSQYESVVGATTTYPKQPTIPTLDQIVWDGKYIIWAYDSIESGADDVQWINKVEYDITSNMWASTENANTGRGVKAMSSMSANLGSLIVTARNDDNLDASVVVDGGTSPVNLNALTLITPLDMQIRSSDLSTSAEYEYNENKVITSVPSTGSTAFGAMPTARYSEDGAAVTMVRDSTHIVRTHYMTITTTVGVKTTETTTYSMQRWLYTGAHWARVGNEKTFTGRAISLISLSDSLVVMLRHLDATNAIPAHGELLVYEYDYVDNKYNIKYALELNTTISITNFRLSVFNSTTFLMAGGNVAPNSYVYTIKNGYIENILEDLFSVNSSTSNSLYVAIDSSHIVEYSPVVERFLAYELLVTL